MTFFSIFHWLLSDLNRWSSSLEGITGFSMCKLSDLCCKIYRMCFVDKCTVKDHRNVELKAIVQRYVQICALLTGLGMLTMLLLFSFSRFSDPRFMGVSKMNVSKHVLSTIVVGESMYVFTYI